MAAFHCFETPISRNVETLCVHPVVLTHLSSPLKSIFENPSSAVNCIHETLVYDSICVLIFSGQESCTRII